MRIGSCLRGTTCLLDQSLGLRAAGPLHSSTWIPTPRRAARREPSKVLRAKIVAPKKKPFNSTGGFMGYVFPAAKKLTNTNVRSVTQPTKIHTDDCKWLLGYAMSLSKKLFGEFSGGIHPVNAALLFQKGWFAIPSCDRYGDAI